MRVGASVTVLVLVVAPARATAKRIPLSQHGTVTQRVGHTEIAISYNRPVARGRKLFGGIVRWGAVWHPGADSATTIQFSRAVLVQGRPLAAGRYTLWTIPDSLQWTVIFSRAVNVFHVPYPGESLDVLRVTVSPEQGSHMEVLAYYFPVVGPDSAVLRLHWGTTMVPLHIRTTP
ncbi:MAG: hypothetical protein AUH46_00895 [Gemmatimonadetes bacterium 13_1_40CM_70_15]|nr:MAG: hypothetical protein AUH46_00895 [Gemmatimonadetes bacterium 13_1_40CM_70_15]